MPPGLLLPAAACLYLLGHFLHRFSASSFLASMVCPSALPISPPAQEAEGLVGELSEVVRQQKLRMRGLAQEKAEASARLAAMNPQVLPSFVLLLGVALLAAAATDAAAAG